MGLECIQSHQTRSSTGQPCVGTSCRPVSPDLDAILLLDALRLRLANSEVGGKSLSSSNKLAGLGHPLCKSHHGRARSVTSSLSLEQCRFFGLEELGSTMASQSHCSRPHEPRPDREACADPRRCAGISATPGQIAHHCKMSAELVHPPKAYRDSLRPSQVCPPNYRQCFA